MSKTALKNVHEDVKHRARMKRDFVVPVEDLEMNSRGELMFKAHGDYVSTQLNDWSSSQLFSKLGMPSHYFKNAIKHAPDAVSDLVNHHLVDHEHDSKKGNPESWLIRTYDAAICRGLLSSRYSKLDDDFLLESLTKLIGNDHEIKMYHTDDRHLQLRVTFPDLTFNMGMLKNGQPDIVQAGVLIMNSEVGAKALTIESVLYRQICTNGLVVRIGGEVALQQRHLHLRDHEIQNRVKDALQKCIRGAYDSAQPFEASKTEEIVEPLTIIDELAKQQKYSDKFTDSIKTSYLAEKALSGDSKFTLLNALTDAAKQLNPDSRVDVEKFAGKLLLSNVSDLNKLGEQHA